jgi:excisionase family DNA binding protein
VNNIKPAPRMLNVRDTAAYLGCSVWCVRTLYWERKLKAITLGSRLLFDRADLDTFVEREKSNAV